MDNIDLINMTDEQRAEAINAAFESGQIDAEAPIAQEGEAVVEQENPVTPAEEAQVDEVAQNATVAGGGLSPEVQALIESMSRKNDLLYNEILQMKQQAQPQQQQADQAQQPEMSEDERWLDTVMQSKIQQYVAPLTQENAELKQTVAQMSAFIDNIKQQEQQKATDAFVAEMKSQYADFDAKAIEAQMVQIGLARAQKLEAQGVPHEKAIASATEYVRDIYDNAEGIEALYLRSKAQNPNIRRLIGGGGTTNPPVLNPDEHVQSGGRTQPKESLMDMINSGDDAKRAAGINAAFGG